jgi:hypothetical protein
MLGESGFSRCRSLSSVQFEAGSTLSRTAKWAFSETGLVAISISASVKMLNESCFADCRSLSSVTVKSGSTLSRIESDPFQETGLI